MFVEGYRRDISYLPTLLNLYLNDSEPFFAELNKALKFSDLEITQTSYYSLRAALINK